EVPEAPRVAGALEMGDEVFRRVPRSRGRGLQVQRTKRAVGGAFDDVEDSLDEEARNGLAGIGIPNGEFEAEVERLDSGDPRGEVGKGDERLHEADGGLPRGLLAPLAPE